MTTEDLIKLRELAAIVYSGCCTAKAVDEYRELTNPAKVIELLDALEALGREVAELKETYDRHTNALSHDCEALRAELAAIRATQEPVAFLCDATRFKVFRCDGDENGRILGLPRELNGRWVALVAADDDCHLNAVASQDVGALGEALAKNIKRIANEFFAGDDRGDRAAARAIMAMEVEANKLLTSDAALNQSQAARVPDAPPAAKDAGLVADDLTLDEKQAIVELLDEDGHDGEDFQPECPCCTARKKLADSPKLGGV